MVSGVINVLKKDRIVPVLSLDISVPDGSKSQLQLFLGDSESEVVAAFAEAHKLNPQQAESLAVQVHERALFHRLKPLAELPVAGESKPFQMFHGDVLSEAVGRYAEE
eukprot:scaffold509647_cov46-Prasinocladus_malaysianus.AAC.1